jgi:hypothetical protein
MYVASYGRSYPEVRKRYPLWTTTTDVYMQLIPESILDGSTVVDEAAFDAVVTPELDQSF